MKSKRGKIKPKTSQEGGGVNIKRLTTKFMQPLTNIFEGLASADVVDDKSSNGTSIIGSSDRSETLLASSVPDLSFDLPSIDLHRLCLELDTDRRFAV